MELAGADVYHMLVSYWMALFSCQSEYDTVEVMELAGADVYHMLVSYWMAQFSCQFCDCKFASEEVMELAWCRCLPYACFLLDGALFMSD
jgi:hypothetical protein